MAAPLSVEALLGELGIDARVVAVELNRMVVKRPRYADTMITEGAEVEIVAFVGGGSGGRRRIAPGALLLACLAFAPALNAPLQAQAGGSTQATLTEETILVYQGWALLAAGDAAKASEQASLVLAKYPRSGAALNLLVEADLARAGAMAGLDSYERWLGSRTVEDAYVLRRIAHAQLWAAVRRPETRIEALQFLAADGDAEARAELARQMVAGSQGELHALAKIGDEGAVRQLVQRLEALPGSKLPVIEALVASRNPLAVAPLVQLLGDTNHPDNVAAAADGLGKLGATQAVARLRQIYADPAQPGFVKFKVAAALYRMEDTTGLAVLQRQLNSEFPTVRAGAAEDMASHPDPAWQAVVRGLAADGDPAVRLKAAELIAPFDHDLAKGTLERLLADENQAIRELATRVMADRVAGDFGTLRRLMRSADPVSQVRAAGRVLELTR